MAQQLPIIQITRQAVALFGEAAVAAVVEADQFGVVVAAAEQRHPVLAVRVADQFGAVVAERASPEAAQQQMAPRRVALVGLSAIRAQVTAAPAHVVNCEFGE